MPSGGLTNAPGEWLQPLRPPHTALTGRPAADHRRILNGMWWSLRPGSWRKAGIVPHRCDPVTPQAEATGPLAGDVPWHPSHGRPHPPGCRRGSPGRRPPQHYVSGHRHDRPPPAYGAGQRLTRPGDTRPTACSGGLAPAHDRRRREAAGARAADTPTFPSRRGQRFSSSDSDRPASSGYPLHDSPSIQGTSRRALRPPPLSPTQPH